MKKQTILILWMSSVLFSGCQFFQKTKTEDVPAPSVIGQWEAKAMIKSHQTGDASIVSLDVMAQQPQPMRVDVTTSLGISLASIVIKDDQIEYVLPKQKKYYQGPVSEGSLQPILKIKVDPKILAAAFFETSYPQWNCAAEGGALMNCATPDGVQIKWIREPQSPKTVFVTSPDFDVQIQVKSFAAKNEIPASALVLKIPENFKKYKLK